MQQRSVFNIAMTPSGQASVAQTGRTDVQFNGVDCSYTFGGTSASHTLARDGETFALITESRMVQAFGDCYGSAPVTCTTTAVFQYVGGEILPGRNETVCR